MKLIDCYIINGYKYVLQYLIIVLIFFIAYTAYLLTTNNNDIFNIQVFKKYKDYTWWEVMHFILFAGLGFVFPNHHVKYFLVGVALEGVELGLHSFKFNKHFAKFLNCDHKYELNDSWWQDNTSLDLISNTLGYAVGSYLSNYCTL